MGNPASSTLNRPGDVMIVGPGFLVYRNGPTATHTARAVARSNGYTRVISIDIQGLAMHRGGVCETQ